MSLWAACLAGWLWLIGSHVVRAGRPLLAAWTVRAGLLAVRMSHRGEGRACGCARRLTERERLDVRQEGAPVFRRCKRTPAVPSEVESVCATVMERFEQIKREEGNDAADAFMVEVIEYLEGPVLAGRAARDA